MKYSYYGKRYSFPDTMTDDDALELMEQDRQSVPAPPPLATPESARETGLMAPPSVTPDTFKPQVVPPSTTEQPTDAKPLGNQAILVDKVNPVGYGLRKAAEGALNIANVGGRIMDIPGKVAGKVVEKVTGNDALTNLANQPNGIEMLRDAIKVKPEEEFALSTQGLNDMEIAGVTQMVAELPEYIGAGMPINKAVASVAAKFSPKVLNAVASVKPLLQGAIRDFLTGFSVQEAKGIGSGETPLEAAPEAAKTGAAFAVGGAGAGVGGAVARKITPELGRIGQVGGEAVGGGGAMATLAAAEGAPPDQVASQVILGAGFQGVMGALSKIGKKDFNRALKESAKEQGFALDETFDTPAFIRRKGEALNIYSKLSNETKAELSKLLTQETPNAEGITGPTRTTGDQIQQGPEATRPATAEVQPPTEGAVAVQPATQQPESGMLAYGQKLPEMPESKINFKRIINEGLTPEAAGEESYSIKKSILNSYDQNRGYFEERARNKQTWEDTERESQKYGLTSLDVVKRKSGETWNAGKMLYSRGLEIAAHKSVRDLRDELYKKPQDQITDADRGQLAQSIAEASAISAEVFGAKRESARALNILRKAAQMDAGKDYTKLLNAFSQEMGIPSTKWTKDIMDKFIRLSPDEAQKIIDMQKSLVKPPIGSKALYVWLNFLLSGPVTHVKNVTGTALNMPLAVTRRGMAATGELLRHPIDPSKRNVYFSEVGELVGTPGDFVNSFGRAIKLFGLAIKNAESPYSDATKLEGQVKHFSPAVRRFMPTTLLGAEDAFTQTLLRSMEARAQAKRQAIKDFYAKKITKDQIDATTEEYVNNPTDKMVEKITKFSQYNSFADEPGYFAKLIGSLRKPYFTLSNGTQIVNPMAFVIPFHNSPSRILSYVIEHSPAGFATKGVKSITQWGKKKLPGIPKDEIAEEFAKPVLGSMVMGAGIALAMQGRITGNGPANRDERKIWLQTNRPYSIEFGGKWFPYGGIEPVSSILGTAVDFHDAYQRGEMNGEDFGELSWRFGSTLMRNFAGKQYAQWVPDVMEIVNPSDDYEKFNRVIQKWSTPMPVFVSAAARSVDPYYRYAPTWKDQYMMKTPYLSKFLYPRRDIWGEPIKREGNAALRFFSPSQPLIQKVDNTAKEVWDVGAVFRVPNDRFTISEEKAKELDIKGRSVQLTPQEYDLLTMNTGEYGKDAVVSVIGSVGYKNKDRLEKSDLIEDSYGDATRVIGKAMRDLALERRKENKEHEPITQQQLDARILGYVLSKEDFSIDQMKQWVSRMKSLTSEQKQAAIGDAVKLYSKRKAEGMIKAAMPNEPRIDNPFLPGGN